MEWLQLLLAGCAGGLIGALLNVGYTEYSRRSDRSRSARRFVDENLDPVLKAADELVAKLLSLAKDDFRSIHKVEQKAQPNFGKDFNGLLFLLANFWARVEIFRHEGLSISLTKDKRGKSFQDFMNCLESRKIRLVDRLSQRAVGELMRTEQGSLERTTSFIAFARLLEPRSDAHKWLSPVIRFLSRTRHTYERQRILQYGIVVHAMIDTLDPDHVVTRNRPSYPHKLSKKSRNELKFRVFREYLSLVPNREKYLGPPKRQP